MLEFLITIRDVGILGAGVVEIRHAARERLHFFFNGMEIVEHRQALGEDGAAGKCEAVLGKVSGGSALGA